MINEPTTPSVESISTDAAPAQARSEAPEGDSPPSWWHRIWRGRHAEDRSNGDQDATPATNAASATVALTQEELDRRVQSETDRREAKRFQAAQEAERRRLRDEDPWAYAEQDRNAEATQVQSGQLSSLFTQIGSQFDKYTLDPLVQALPEQERARILGMEGAGLGLDGRKLVVSEALKSMEQHWKTEGARDAETKLRRNPAFRKQVLAEMRGLAAEPEFLPSAAPSSNGPSVSDLLRGQLGVRH